MKVSDVNPAIQDVLPCLKQRLVTYTSTKNPDDKSLMIHDYEGLRLAIVPPEEFRISYHGLSEPSSASIWRYELLLIGGIAAVIALIVGMIYWRRRRRTRRASVPVNAIPVAS